MSDWWLGFDIGGTRIKSGVVDADGAVSRTEVAETDLQPFETVWRAMLDYADAARADRGSEGLRGVGIAAPGLVDPAFGVRNLPGKVPGIEDFPMRERLEASLGVPVRCVNDGAAATLAEWRFGAARGHDDVVGLNFSEAGRRIPRIPENDDALGAQTSIYVRVVDDFAAKKDPAVGKLLARLVGVFHGPVDTVAETEFARELHAQLSCRSIVSGFFEPLDNPAPVTSGESGSDGCFQAESLLKVRIRHVPG